MSINDHMAQVHDLGDSFEELLDKFRSTLDDTRRHWAAYMLSEYPRTDVLEASAARALEELGARMIEVNAIYNGKQVTVMTAPRKPRRTIDMDDSLCSITVGAGQAIAVDDIQDDRVTAHHAVRELWGSWASVPLVIDGITAGTMCALENEARRWNGRDQACLESIAKDLATQVEAWAQSQKNEGGF